MHALDIVNGERNEQKHKSLLHCIAKKALNTFVHKRTIRHECNATDLEPKKQKNHLARETF